jgi:transposase
MIRGLMTDDEWEIVAPFLTTPSSGGGRPPGNHRRRLDGVLWICRTGAPWRDLPETFGNWNSVWRQFRRWSLSGVWHGVLQALADSGGELDRQFAVPQRLHHLIGEITKAAAGLLGRFGSLITKGESPRGSNLGGFRMRTRTLQPESAGGSASPGLAVSVALDGLAPPVRWPTSAAPHGKPASRDVRPPPPDRSL